MSRKRHILHILALIMGVVGLTKGHGRLMDPPARNSMWRFGFPNPVNYNDNELYCGGFTGLSIIINQFVYYLIIMVQCSGNKMMANVDFVVTRTMLKNLVLMRLAVCLLKVS